MHADLINEHIQVMCIIRNGHPYPKTLQTEPKISTGRNEITCVATLTTPELWSECESTWESTHLVAPASEKQSRGPLPVGLKGDPRYNSESSVFISAT